MKLIVLGAGGMVGSALVKKALEWGIAVEGVTRQKVDICSVEQLRAVLKPLCPTHIVNCAAFTDVEVAERQVEQAHAVNAEGAKNAALVAYELGARFIHISTDYVFGSVAGTTPYLETDPCGPLNSYGKSKVEGEVLVRHAHPQCCILRTSWVFGLKSKNLISSLLSRFLIEKQLSVVTDQVGKPTYCYDLAEAILRLLDIEGIVHFANEGASSRYDIAKILLSLSQDCRLPVVCNQIIPALSTDFPTAALRPFYSVLDTTKYTAITSIKPRLWTESALEFLSL